MVTVVEIFRPKTEVFDAKRYNVHLHFPVQVTAAIMHGEAQFAGTKWHLSVGSAAVRCYWLLKNGTVTRSALQKIRLFKKNRTQGDL